MKKLSKILSVGLSLVMCASMVAPALALDIDQAYIDSLTVKNGNQYDGRPTSYVELKATDDDNVFNFLGDIRTEHSLVFKGDDVTVNLNGHTLENTGNTSAIWTKNTNLTVNGADENGNKGTIEGGNAAGEDYLSVNNGGGIHAEGGNLAVSDVEFTGNKAVTDGAAIWAAGNGKEGSNVTIKNVTVTNGEMGDGGAITVTGHDNASLENVSITGNVAQGAGGGLVIQNGGSASLTNVTVSGNEATGSTLPNTTPRPVGGGIYFGYLDKVSMKNVEVTGNSAAKGGGGVAAEVVGTITMEDVTITGNTAGYYGGGLYVYAYGSTTVSATNTVIADNKGYWGGQEAFDNDVYAFAYYGSIELSAGAVTHNKQQFDGWGDSTVPGEFARVGDEAGEDGIFENSFRGDIAYMTSHWITPEPDDGDNGGEIPNTPVTDPTVEIDDVEVPLAGLFTRADAIGYLWEQTGSPEWELSDFPDVPEDHYWAVAIGWAQDMGIALPDEDGNFRPDEPVLRSVEDLEIDPEGELQEFLNRYAVFAGIELDEGELFIELAGAWDDVIMGEEAQVIFNDFFAKLELALAQAA
ncbi:MAG: hypothetical protein HDT33_01480 [Clostridiales bacterium]|nr:hypothetical protein [Clostridiales bacterium]